MSTSKLKAVWHWVDERFPTLNAEYKKHMSEYYAPKNFNIWYVFGVLSALVLLLFR